MAIAIVIILILLFVFVAGIILCVVCDDLDHEPILKEENEMIKFMLKYGDENKLVAEAQNMLQASGSTIKVTGKYTIGMISAVKSFQKKNGLPVTGKIDTKTMNKLKTFVKPAKPARKATVCKKAPAKKPVKK